jgi:hypothetical protein
VWEDHLLPLLTCRDGARLGCTCKALRVVVREHFKDLGDVRLDRLQAALTTFTRARSVAPYFEASRWRSEAGGWGLDQANALALWLQEDEGPGRGLTTITKSSHAPEMASLFIHAALQGGAFPSLKAIAAELYRTFIRGSLTGGFLRDIHELQLIIDCTDDDMHLEPQLAALGLVRELPALAKLELRTCTQRDRDPPQAVQWPPFLPPSLKALRFSTIDGDLGRSFLCALPNLLEASGARLDRLDLLIPPDFEGMGEALVHLAQALRCCSPTLKDLCLAHAQHEAEDPAHQAERLRVPWADVLAGVSACRELQMLELPLIEVESLFPPGTAFARLTILEMGAYGREHQPGAGATGLWELMASGGLPALVKLKVMLEGRWGGKEEVRTRVGPALEAVAGTLKHLFIATPEDCRWVGDEGMLYELGVVVDKLRRLKDLALYLSRDGRAYHAVAQGLAASGGECPLPLLWRVGVIEAVDANADLLGSLILPSVRVFRSSHKFGTTKAALLTACALRRVGYKHVWALRCREAEGDVVRAIAECCLRHVEMHDRYWGVYRAID